MKNLLLIIMVFVIACGGKKNINQEGYFKKNKNRITTHSFKKGTSKQEIIEYASKLMNTPNRLTVAYFYTEGSQIPRDGITLAKSEFEANYVLYDMEGLSKWRYSYMRFINGSIKFIDCQEIPNNELCRQN